MYRFFVDKKIDNKYFALSNEVLNHLKTIRLKKTESFICVYEKEFYICKLENNNALILDKLDENHEYKNNVVLFSSIIKIKHFEWLIQKATELGVKEFFPLITKNTNTKYIELIKRKKQRLDEIAKNAAEQSFRNQIMKINDPIKFEDAITYSIDNKFLAHEKTNYSNKISNFQGNVAFFVGPEGGFDENEIKLAINNDVKIISLGKRILRSETSSIYLLSKINEE